MADAADATSNGIVRRALDLLTGRYFRSTAGLDNADASVLRAAGKAYVDSLSDEELRAELDRRSRDTLIDWGIQARRNERPPRPKTDLTERIRERKRLEKEHRSEMLEKRRAYFEARDELAAAAKARPPDPAREEAARQKVQDADFEMRRAESQWRRTRSGRHALQLAEDRLIAQTEYTASLRERGFI
jgi:hypothetical protein